MIIGDADSVKVTLHTGLLSYLTIDIKLCLTVKNDKGQTYDLPTAFSVALLQKFTVKTY